MAKREPEFYWVRQKLLYGSPQGWEIGRFEVGLWTLTGNSDEFQGNDLYDIGERVERHGWSEPQPVTAAQKTGERFLVWYEAEYQRGWHVAKWDSDVEMWLRGSGEEHYLQPEFVTLYLPLPPDPRS